MSAHSFVQAVVRLVPPGRGAVSRERPRCYRPLVVGPALLWRPAGSTGRWSVAVSEDGRLLPLAPPSIQSLWAEVARHRAAGRQCRIATALACSADVPSAVERHGADPAAAALRSEFYGWSLMIQPAGIRGRAFVDADDAFPDLPACFELPLELIDRMAFLEARGFRTRPIALVTRPEDFETVAGRLRNRFRPDARFHKPFALDRLL